MLAPDVFNLKIIFIARNGAIFKRKFNLSDLNRVFENEFIKRNCNNNNQVFVFEYENHDDFERLFKKKNIEQQSLNVIHMFWSLTSYFAAFKFNHLLSFIIENTADWGFFHSFYIFLLYSLVTCKRSSNRYLHKHLAWNTLLIWKEVTLTISKSSKIYKNPNPGQSSLKFPITWHNSFISILGHKSMPNLSALHT